MISGPNDSASALINRYELVAQCPRGGDLDMNLNNRFSAAPRCRDPPDLQQPFADSHSGFRSRARIKAVFDAQQRLQMD